MLIAEGFTSDGNLIERLKGDRDDNSVRALNGWRNAGVPWDYRLANRVGYGFRRQTLMILVSSPHDGEPTAFGGGAMIAMADKEDQNRNRANPN